MESECQKFIFQVWSTGSLSMRIDTFLSLCLEISRNQLQKRRESLKVNGRECKLSCKVKHHDLIEMVVLHEKQPSLVAEKIPLEIVYENDELIVINKEQGLVVHPGDGHSRLTLIQGLLFYDQRLSALDYQHYRLGLVHRLDKDTSGLILVARNSKSHDFLSRQFATRNIEKHYLAVVRGQIKGTGLIDVPITRDPNQRKKFIASNQRKGKEAQTHYQVLQRWGNYALIKLKPRTGRTHQIRCHLKYLQSPILGDPIYARKDTSYPQATLMLHALALNLPLPNRENKRTWFYAPLPHHFKELLRQIAREQKG